MDLLKSISVAFCFKLYLSVIVFKLDLLKSNSVLAPIEDINLIDKVLPGWFQLSLSLLKFHYLLFIGMMDFFFNSF